MASIDSLPADQRAVLQLVLQRGRSYDDIARLLSIDRGAVRHRAQAALDALGPETGVPPERRALITDYLLGQLPAQAAETTREQMAQSPTERAWARVVASELAPIASRPLPEISAEAGAGARAAGGKDAGEPVTREPAADEREPTAGPVRRGWRRQQPERAAPASAQHHEPAGDETEGYDGLEASGIPGTEKAEEPRSSRRGGAILLGLGGLAVVAAVVAVILILSGGGGSSSNHAGTNTSGAAAANTAPATTGTNPTTTGTTSTTPTRVVGQVNLLPPTGSTSKAKGIAEVLKQGSAQGIAIVAEGVPPNTKHDAYAVWLYNSPSDAELLGFVNPGVGSNGRFSAARQLPGDASHFKGMVVTLETHAQPHQPGMIVLQGQLNGVS